MGEMVPRGLTRPALFQLCLLLILVPYIKGRTFEKCLPGNTCRSEKPPVVLIPGDLGNQLEAKLDKPSVVHYICYKKTDVYFTLWLNLELLVPVAIDCWIDNIRLIYNRTTRQTEAPPGVDVRVPGFGQTFPLEYLDPSKGDVGMYFFTIVQALVEWGYTRDDDVRGAPYDWRKAPNENKAYFLRLQHMIEEMAVKARGPVVLVAHSMGNMYTLYFLNHQPQAWKDRYIKAFVSLGAPWAGVAKTLRVVATGDNNRIPVISSLKIRSQQRSAVSTTWLFPYAHSWPADKVLIQTPTTNYTVKDYQRFFKDIDFEDGWEMRQDTESLVSALEPPGVAIHCLYGSGVPTAEGFLYTNFSDSDPTLILGDGDGTVNLLSATQCKRWIGHQTQPVHMLELEGNEHVAMLLNFTTVAYIKTVLFGP
ncbi:phospholipase A2, group XV precursor [Salmo salar]|uniref:1-O-acylceramide synthase n=1 Tax=Salmo salar TaxID=8030 RepID=B5X139_SALSA|nr:phospholipase A2, group XV precursor [Salmo salar]ACI33020.1 1-O-acylceramide synthase precursor [Salmo salar]|eukprot:NP_001133318.1 1-O-acylceramide synthase precursor [Salmo salar]